MSKYIGNHPVGEIVQYSGSRWDYVNTENPSYDTDPDKTGATWLNLTTGEEFVCTNNTAGFNEWVGSLGTWINVLTALAPEMWIDFGDPTTMFTDAGTTNVLTDGQLIYQVNDKAQNGHNLVQTNSTYRPQYKLATRNGMSSALFDGSNDYMFENTLLLDANMTTFIVCQDSPQTAGGSIWRTVWGGNNGSFSTATQYGFHMQRDAAYTVAMLIPQTGTEQSTSLTGLKDSVYHTYTLASLNGLCQLTEDGSRESVETQSTRSSGYTAGYSVGRDPGDSSRRYKGNILEIVTYDYWLTDAQQARVEEYLNNKWSLY